MQVNEDVLRLQHIEQQIDFLETELLLKTVDYGNLVNGWDTYLSGFVS